MDKRAGKFHFIVAAVDGNEYLRTLHVTHPAQHRGRLVIEDRRLRQSERVLLVKGQHHGLAPEQLDALGNCQDVRHARVQAVQLARPTQQFQAGNIPKYQEVVRLYGVVLHAGHGHRRDGLLSHGVNGAVLFGIGQHRPGLGNGVVRKHIVLQATLPVHAFAFFARNAGCFTTHARILNDCRRCSQSLGLRKRIVSELCAVARTRQQFTKRSPLLRILSIHQLHVDAAHVGSHQIRPRMISK